MVYFSHLVINRKSQSYKKIAVLEKFWGIITKLLKNRFNFTSRAIVL